MKVAVSKNNNTSNAHISRPFFGKRGENNRYSGSSDVETPFFSPMIQPKQEIGLGENNAASKAHTVGVSQNNPAWSRNSGDNVERQYLQNGGSCPPAASGGGRIRGTANALGQRFIIHEAGMSVSGRLRQPRVLGVNTLQQHGPSFSMNAGVEAPAGATGYRIGVIQQVVSSNRHVHYNNIRTSRPWRVSNWPTVSGLDIARDSTPPWYSSSRVEEMDQRGVTGIVDDPGGDFYMVVNDQGQPRPSFTGILTRYSGCDHFRVWLVVEAPGSSRRQAIATGEWVANFDIDYNISFHPSGSRPPTFVSASSGSDTGWISSPLRIGAGQPIPSSVTPPRTPTWDTP